MKTLVQSCKITIGNAESGHTVHFPDGCNEHVESRPFEDIDGVIERAIRQREERETREAIERPGGSSEAREIDGNKYLVEFDGYGGVQITMPTGGYRFLRDRHEDVDVMLKRVIAEELEWNKAIAAQIEATVAREAATPPYYRFRIKGVDCDVFDIAKSAGLTPASTMALKYLLRAGKKDGAVSDLRKCIRCVEREIELGEGAK